ncbi:MAG: hypothetical protein V4819_19665 [Verrucomicrobiota bacterium]
MKKRYLLAMFALTAVSVPSAFAVEGALGRPVFGLPANMIPRTLPT